MTTKKRSSNFNHNNLGLLGEKLACDFLQTKGYQIIKKNFRTRYGEIDLIAYDQNYLTFIEVKTRSSSIYGTAEESVDLKKQKQILKTALHYLSIYDLSEALIRFDIVSIYTDQNPAGCILFQNAFSVEQLEII